MTAYFAGVDVGGTHIKVHVVDGAFNSLAHSQQPTTISSPETLTTTIVETIDQAVMQANLTLSDLHGVGVGVPGQVDTIKGIVRHAVNLNISSFPLAEALIQALGCPVVIDNDVIMAAIGAYQFLNPENIIDFCYLNIGTGVSAGVILGGRLHRGQNGMAGEIGHMVIVGDGRLCPCGNLGCLEAYIAGPAIAAAGQEALVHTPNSLMAIHEGPFSAAAVYQAAGLGDAAALAITREAGRHLGRALQNLIMAYDIGKIVLGGGVTRTGDLFMQPVLEEWFKQTQRSKLAKTMLQPHILTLSPDNYNPGIWGAVAMAKKNADLYHGNSINQNSKSVGGQVTQLNKLEI